MARRISAAVRGGTGPTTLIFDNNIISSATINADLILSTNGDGKVSINKNILVSSNTSSTNSTTGSLVVTGGLGISENLYVGGLLNITGSITSSGNISGPSLRITDTGTVGIGTLTNPTFKLEVHHTSEWPITSRFSNPEIGLRGTILTLRSLGTKSSPTTVTSGTNIGGISIGGYDGSSWVLGYNGGAEIMALTTETWTSTAHGTQLGFYTTPTGQINSVERARFDGSGHFVPALNNTYDLGTTSLRWRNIYTQDLHLSNGIGDYTVIEGTDDLFLVNNKNGKSYKFALIEVDPEVVPPKSI